jgi:hypothetical protein
MDGPSPRANKKYTGTVAAFGRLLPTVRARGERAVNVISSQNKRNVKETTMKRSTIAQTFAIGAVAALALNLAPLAKAERKECSAATLEGSFVRTDTGFVTAPPTIAGPLAGVHLLVFSGYGTFTSAGFASLNGNVSESTGTGTYTVNPDCTGNYTSVSSTGRTGTAFFVIADNGNEIHILPTNPGASLTCIARKVFPVGNPKD